jgi:CheY-like chemotaxis protein
MSGRNLNKKILIVDDNQELVRALQLLLKNYNLILAENGKQAVEIAFTLQPDLILMDILMPEMDGLQATRMIRQNPQTRSIPILAITAGISIGIEEECSQSGCDDFIAKPFTIEQLASRIENLLQP